VGYATILMQQRDPSHAVGYKIYRSKIGTFSNQPVRAR